jgi:hypothetical protein
MKNYVIKIIAIVCGIIGVYYLFRNFRANVWYLSEIMKGQYPIAAKDVWMVGITFFAFIILLLRPVAAYGLFYLRRWGKTLAVAIFTGDFIIRAIGFINISTYSLRHPESRQLAATIMKSIADAQARGEKTHYEIISMVPSYIIGLISLISVIILLKIKPER